MRKPTITRRSLLAGMGVSGALLPFIPSLESHAGGSTPPKRLLLFYTPNGVIPDDWECAGSGTNFELSPILAPLQDYKNDLLILDGVDVEAAYNGPTGHDGHRAVVNVWTGWELAAGDAIGGNGIPLTGWPKGPSVDQVVADAFEGQTPLRSLALSVLSGDNLARKQMIHRAAGEPVPQENDPYKTYEKLFAEIALDPAAQLALRDRRMSVIDAVKDDLGDLQSSVPQTDRFKIDAHLANLRALEGRLAGAAANCEPPVLPGGVDLASASQMPTIGTMQMQLIASAFACDMTRVASILWMHEGGGLAFNWLGHQTGYHGLSHDMTPQYTECWTWYAEKFRELLDLLASYQESDGTTLLDNTVVVWASGIGRSGGHSNRRIPLAIAGSGGGYFSTGRCLKWDSDPVGLPINNALLSVCHAMGLDNLDTFGNPEFCDGPISELLG